MYNRVIDSDWVMINQSLTPCKFSTAFHEYLCLRRHDNHFDYDTTKHGLLTPTRNYSIEFLMAATHSFIEFGDTLVVPLRAENKNIQETLSFMFVASLTDTMAKSLWEQYAHYHSIRSVERFAEALESNKSHVWSWLKLQASTSVNSDMSSKASSSLEDDLMELLCEFREDEQLKKQRRNMSLDIDKGYFEGCESTLAYV
ncbi:conserved hypothetical protein [Vibrio crassostreae]|nr:conserved hypothetical protein [Vibrio crassostreae]CAK3044823.1 conserved hypothetical protein [Vibrio crassostreae]CAK3586002.1 conserved hypothetical protein [Vibrio crassostreae]CAK3984606.1 conserved hypothetical protein [Vibrio crassostreae]